DGDRGGVPGGVRVRDAGADQRRLPGIRHPRQGAGAGEEVPVMGYPHKPHRKETAVLSKYFGDPEARASTGWVKRGGYEGWRQALTLAPAAITDLAKEPALR